MVSEQEIKEAVQELRNVNGVNGVALVTCDGLLIYSDLPKDANDKAIAAMAAAIVGTALQVVKELEIGNLSQVMVDAIDGKFISLSISEDEESPILSVLVSPKANIGLVLLEMERTAKKLRKLFE